MDIFIIGITLIGVAFLGLLIGAVGIALVLLAIGVIVVPLAVLFVKNIHWMDIYSICISLFICAACWHWSPIALVAIFAGSVLIFVAFRKSAAIQRHWKPIFWILCIPGSLLVADITSYFLFAFFRIEFVISAIIVFALSIARHIYQYKQVAHYNLSLN